MKKGAVAGGRMSASVFVNPRSLVSLVQMLGIGLVEDLQGRTWNDCWKNI